MAEINISDLSVGDWVFCDRGTTPYSIRSIVQTGEQKCVVVNDKCHPNGVTALVKYLKPIPLTPEILEKNGFEKNGKYSEWNIGTWETPDLIGVSLERPSIIVKYKGSSIFLDQAKHTHQLQHALRLAGVAKEIEI